MAEIYANPLLEIILGRARPKLITEMHGERCRVTGRVTLHGAPDSVLDV